MYPRLFETSYFTLHTFGVLLAAAVLAALWWVARSARRDGLDSDAAVSLGLWTIIGGVLGAKVLMVLRTLPLYAADPSQLWSLSSLTSAGDFYGGFLGALAAAALFFRRRPELPVWRMLDVCAPAVALGQAVGRLGCFMAGDDYGSPTGAPWAVTFTDPEAARIGGTPLGVPLHPVQLYESAACLALFALLAWMSRRRRFDGQVFLSYVLLYAAARFLIEFFRGDADRGFVFGGLLSTSQFIALAVGAASAALFAHRLLSGGPALRGDFSPSGGSTREAAPGGAD